MVCTVAAWVVLVVLREDMPEEGKIPEPEEEEADIFAVAVAAVEEEVAGDTVHIQKGPVPLP